MNLSSADASLMPAFITAKRVGRAFEVQGHQSHAWENSTGSDPVLKAGWAWDGSQLNVWSDRYGMYPIYVCLRQDQIFVSTNLSEMVKLTGGSALDYSALAVFVRLGFFLGNDTHFADIRRVGPSDIIAWPTSHTDLVTSTSQPAVASIQISRSEAMAQFQQQFEAAIAASINGLRPSRILLPLSGGRDSRHILFELLRRGHKPKVMTARYFPPRSNEDLDIASLIASKFELTHSVINQSGNQFEAELRKNALTDFMTDEHAWYLRVAHELDLQGGLVFDGIGGDVLSGRLFATEDNIEAIMSGEPERFFRSLFLLDEPTLASLLGRGAYSRLGPDLASDRLDREYRIHERAPNPLSSFIFWNRTRREIALVPCCILSRMEVALPYLYPSVFDFLSSLPLDLTADRRFHADTIAAFYPRWREIPYSDVPFEPFKESVRDPWHFSRFTQESMDFLESCGSLELVDVGCALNRLRTSLEQRSYQWWLPLILTVAQFEISLLR